LHSSTTAAEGSSWRRHGANTTTSARARGCARLVRSPPNGAESLFCCRSRQHVAELTTRELEVLRLVAAGLSNQEIAATRNRSSRASSILKHRAVRATLIHPPSLSFKTRFRGPIVAQTSVGRLAHPCGRGRETRRKVPAHEAVLRRSSLGVAVPYSASHAGGRGFESRRSRHKAPANALSCCLNRQRPRAHATHTRVRGDPKRAKTARKRVRGSSSSRFRRALRPTARGSRRSHRMAGGQAIKETLPHVSRKRT
jgi:Bacterial regulatory proteins, luxR family